MSPGAIAVTAILVSGAEVGSLITAGAWLIYTKRIMLAATPKPPGPPAGETNRKRKAGADTPEVPAAEPAKTGPIPFERAS